MNRELEKALELVQGALVEYDMSNSNYKKQLLSFNTIIHHISKQDTIIEQLEQSLVEGNQNVQEKNYKLQSKLGKISENITKLGMYRYFLPDLKKDEFTDIIRIINNILIKENL